MYKHGITGSCHNFIYNLKKETPYYFQHNTTLLIYNPENSIAGFPFLNIVSTPVVSCVFDNKNSNRYDVIVH